MIMAYSVLMAETRRREIEDGVRIKQQDKLEFKKKLVDLLTHITNRDIANLIIKKYCSLDYKIVCNMDSGIVVNESRGCKPGCDKCVVPFFSNKRF